MINVPKIYRLLKGEGVDFVAGVPDTLLNDFCLGLDDVWRSPKHVIAANEGNAIALAAGYHLATGSVPLVYMQNSGLGNAMNPLISLVDPKVYSIPLVLLIGWRGEPGQNDWPQHQRQGELSPIMLDALAIPHRTLGSEETEAEQAVIWAVRAAQEGSRPIALLVRREVLAKKEKAGFDAERQKYAMSREEAIRVILANAPQDAIYVASTGRITRELHAVRAEMGQPHERDFLNVGAMGHSLSIATGIAAAHPDRNVLCLDGDGAAIMHLGSLPVTANLPLPNLLHLVLNNGAHESVGGQPTGAFDADLNAVAAASGYRTPGASAHTPEQLADAIGRMVPARGPCFIEVRIRKGMRADMPLLKISPQDEKARFMKQIGEDTGRAMGHSNIPLLRVAGA